MGEDRLFLTSVLILCLPHSGTITKSVLPRKVANIPKKQSLYGPLCMNIDIIRDNITLPLLQKGDHLVVHRVGAYNMTQWMQFITLRTKYCHARPGEPSAFGAKSGNA